jgi:isoamylase
MEQLSWFKPDGNLAYWDNEQNYAIAYRIDGTEFSDPASAISVAYNGWPEDIDFTLPPPGNNKKWYRRWIFRAGMRSKTRWLSLGRKSSIGTGGASYNLKGRAVLLLIAK